MAIFLEPNKLNLIGAEIGALSYIIAVEIAKKELNNEDAFEINKLSALADFQQTDQLKK